MKTRQEVCTLVSAALVTASAGCIETDPAVSFALLGAVAVLLLIGRLGRKRVTCRDIERRCRNVR